MSIAGYAVQERPRQRPNAWEMHDERLAFYVVPVDNDGNVLSELNYPVYHRYQIGPFCEIETAHREAAIENAALRAMREGRAAA